MRFETAPAPFVVAGFTVPRVMFLVLLALYIGGALALYGLRVGRVKAGQGFDLLSREGGLVLNNLLLSVILGIVLVGLWYSGSRAALFVLPVILAAGFYMHALSMQVLARALRVAVVLLAFVSIVSGLLDSDGSAFWGAAWRSAMGGATLTSAGSDAERWQSLVGGWEMFLGHPLFGAGLGAFMKDHGIVVHSVPPGAALNAVTPLLRPIWMTMSL